MVDGAGDSQQARRKWHDSLCAKPVEVPRSFHFYSDADSHVRHEIVNTFTATGKPQTAVAGLVGDVYGRMRAAQRGEICDADLLEPIRDVPTLWELKWKLGRLGEYRLYHAEPAADPELVALRFHAKDVSGVTQAIIDEAQDVEIGVAAQRYDDGVKNSWGHRKGCTDCLNP